MDRESVRKKMSKTIDSYKFVSGITARTLKSWAKMENPDDIPWTPLTKPLSECRVSMISSGGMALATDLPFDQNGERQNPWWGDPTHRVIPLGTQAEDIRVYHLHIDPQFAENDLNSLLPIDRLCDLESAGEIGAAAHSHYAFMGYNMQPRILLEETTPAIIRNLRDEAVDVVVLVPA
jgi:D-proline reductase (dithiol) PrdB